MQSQQMEYNHEEPILATAADSERLLDMPGEAEVVHSESQLNSLSQIKGMLRKHWLLKKKMKGQLLWEIVTSFMMGLLLQYMGDSLGRGLAATMMPFFMVFYTPYITLMPSRFIIQSMVEDKATKMRETLRLMSLSRTSYAMSFFIV